MYRCILNFRMKVTKSRLQFFLLLIFFLAAGSISLAAQGIDINRIKSQEEFRFGVLAYHNGNFIESTIKLETSLALYPESDQTKIWLGLAYFRAGLDDAAISIWQNMIDQGYSSAFLQNYIDILRTRTGIDRELAAVGSYVETFSLEGKTDSYSIFQRPGSILASEDGGFYLSSFVTNDIIKFNANGELRRYINGGFRGFDHPFDVILAENGYLYISEFSGNQIVRCLPDGSEITRFGESGSKEGQLYGPQFLAADGNGYIYVSDIGNRKIHKFDLEGNFIFSFGRRSEFFQGFQDPTGVTVLNGFVYVADNSRKEIFIFDESGNFVTSVGKGFLYKPEGLTNTPDGKIIISDTTRVVQYDPQEKKLEVISDFGNSAGKIVKAVYDANRHLLVADFNNNKVSVLTDILNMPAGLFVQTLMVNTEDYPKILVEVAVQDRYGRPFVGLEGKNFRITENDVNLISAQLTYVTDKDKSLSLVFLSDRSPSAAKMNSEMKDAAEKVFDFSKNGGTALVVDTSENPLVQSLRGDDLETFITAAIEGGVYSDKWSLAKGILLAGSSLVNTPGKRAVVFAFSGELPEDAFEHYDLLSSAQYLKNNGIAFYCLYLNPISETYSEKLDYLCRETGGESIYLYRPDGIGLIAEQLRDSVTGRYILEFTSTAFTDFGKRFIPLAVEANIYTRSGKDESGFFSPLVFE